MGVAAAPFFKRHSATSQQNDAYSKIMDILIWTSLIAFRKKDILEKYA